MKEMEQSQTQAVSFPPLFQILFAQHRSWQKAQEMLVGAILCRARLDLRPALSPDPGLSPDAEREQLIHLLASSF